MSDVDVRIRRAEALDDYLACVALQKEVWGYAELEDFAALPLLMIANRFGGCVLIAEDLTARCVGFSFAMPGWKRDRHLFWWSHMTAVAPDVRNREVGLSLKLRQREEALRGNIDVIEWTFDPLQALNAHFNICKLGVVVSEYEENIYGATSSPLHRGLPTDRFVAAWDLRSDRVKERIDSTDRPVILRDLDTIPKINEEDSAPNLQFNAARLLLEIPTDLDKLRSVDIEKAKRWQSSLRDACRHYFHGGYSVTDFLRLKVPREQAFYVLEAAGG